MRAMVLYRPGYDAPPPWPEDPGLIVLRPTVKNAVGEGGKVYRIVEYIQKKYTGEAGYEVVEIVNSVPVTQETTVSEQRVYRLGDTIRLELDVEDPSGVALVQAHFAHTERSDACIRMVKNVGKETSAKVVLEHVVTRSTAPGEYRCSWIYRADAVSNGSSRDSLEHLGFRVEHAGDHEAPEITDARFS
jgi:hypothetical protein